MIGGPAKRDGELQAVERRQEPVEQCFIFDSKLAREPIVGGVVDIEFRLEAGKIGRSLLERGDGFAHLRPNAFSMTRTIALPHTTAPHNFSTSILKLWNRRN